MWFFNSKKKKKKEFEPKVVITENVNDTLVKVAKEYNIALSALDFRLLSCKTYIKFPDSDFQEINKENLKSIMDEKTLLNENFKIKQSYKIEIIKFEPSNNFELLGKMEIDKDYTKASFIVSENSVFQIDNVVEKIKDELNKKKLRNSLLIDVFDLMDIDIKIFKDLISKNKKLENEFTIRLCKGIEAIKTIQGKVIYHFKKHKIKDKLIYPVKKDDILIEIILPKEGKNGRNCKGEIIKTEELKKFEIPNIVFDEDTIKEQKDNEKILFIAKRDGYVVKDNVKFIIKDSMEIRQINLKTGNIEDTQNGDVKLQVKESDSLKEAIADNMKVETTELYVKGNVGNKAKIKTKKLEINGQTHKNSKILADKAFINVHKGELKAKKVKINRLEHGVVKADEVELDLAFGGVVYAKKIKINKLLSHNKCFVSESIKICNVKGEENLLAVSPTKVLDSIDIKSMEKKIIEIKQHINIKKKEYEKLKKIYLKNKKVMEEYKKTYLKNKKEGKKTSAVILKKLKEFKDFINKIESFKTDIISLKKEEENIKNEIEYLQNGIYKAKIISYSDWKPFNRIMFELIEPSMKLIYDTKIEDKKCGFKIKNEEELKIIKIKVKDDICN